MKLDSPQKELYGREQYSAAEAQRRAQEIVWGPIVFQTSRLMIRFGIFEMLSESDGGLTLDEVAERAGLSRYAAQVLLESSLTAQTVLLRDGRFTLAKTGWFLLNDPQSKANMGFNHDVNYLGMFDLEQALREGRPAGLKRLGDWPTIYEGLSQLDEQVQRSWFGFDHYYSDCSFDDALGTIFSRPVSRLLDVGGNTGRFALRCVGYDPTVEVTIMDLPQQIVLMREAAAGAEEADRISGYPADLLDENTAFPEGFDAIMMSQFLDCFSEEQAVSILARAARSMGGDTRLYIMETLWDRQRYPLASYVLAQTSVYFTAMANGNSKMFHSDDLKRMIAAAGLRIETIHDGLGFGHSILVCRV